MLAGALAGLALVWLALSVALMALLITGMKRRASELGLVLPPLNLGVALLCVVCPWSALTLAAFDRNPGVVDVALRLIGGSEPEGGA